jgi:hypothetical protein
LDFTQFLGAIPAALIPVALVLYFSDQNTKSWMTERKELAIAILAERKEFVTTQENLVDRYDARLVASVEAASKMAAELHNLRGIITQFILRLETNRSNPST